jgi:hypothetical protein
VDTIENNLHGDEFWRAHFLKAQEFSGSNTEYCNANGLSIYGFQTNKKRLGFTRSKEKVRPFVKVATIPEKTATPTIAARPNRLPDAKWLAEFVKTVLG